MRSDTFDLTEFRELFEGRIRVVVDWDRIAQLDPQLELDVLDPRVDEAGIFHPWYRDGGGQRVAHDAPGALPLSLKYVREHPAAVHEQDLVRADVSVAEEPYLVTAPCARLSSGARLLLDGNHRVAAAHRSGIDTRILALALLLPADPTLIPDLVHWA